MATPEQTPRKVAPEAGCPAAASSAATNACGAPASAVVACMEVAQPYTSKISGIFSNGRRVTEWPQVRMAWLSTYSLFRWC